MDKSLSSFFSVQTIVFCIVVYLVVQIFRSMAHFLHVRFEKFLPKVADTFLEDLWNEWVLPASPIVFGALMAFFVTNYPYPEIFNKSIEARVFFGIVAGSACSHVYRFFRFHIKKYLPEEIKEKISSLGGGSSTTEDKEEN